MPVKVIILEINIFNYCIGLFYSGELISYQSIFYRSLNINLFSVGILWEFFLGSFSRAIRGERDSFSRTVCLVDCQKIDGDGVL